MALAPSESNRTALLKAFDEARTGVSGLIESSISSVPALFVHPDPYASAPLAPPDVSIPVVDLSLPAPLPAAAAAEGARSWGFFHLVNYHQALDVPEDYLARAFHELPATERAAHYRRAKEAAGGVSYFSNHDLYLTSAASWRDTFQVAFGPTQPDLALIPAICRDEVTEWSAHATVVARAMLGLLSQGLRLHPTSLEEASCLKEKHMAYQYYPVCPEPERTMGIVSVNTLSICVLLV